VPAAPPLFAVLTGNQLGRPVVPLDVLQRNPLAYPARISRRTVDNAATGRPIAFGRRRVNKTFNQDPQPRRAS